MSPLKKEDIKQEVFDLYDDYAHNRIDRRDFMQKLSLYAVGGITVASLTNFLMPDYKGAIQIQTGDPRLKSEYINYPSPKGGGTIKALLSKPVDAKGKLVHCGGAWKQRPKSSHWRCSQRAALAGLFHSLDMLTPLGGYPGNDDQGRELQSKRDRNEMLTDFIAAAEYLKATRTVMAKWALSVFALVVGSPTWWPCEFQI